MTFSKYHILLHLIIFMWGFTGILGKLIHLDSYILVWHRVLIALIGLGIYLLFKKKSILLNTKKDFFSLCIVGIFVAMHWITFYKSIQLSTASLGILCLSTTTLHVTWLDPLVMKRKFSIIEFILGLFVIAGIYIVSSDFSAKDYEALAYGLSSAMFAALFAVFNGKLVQTIPSTTITFYEMTIGLFFLSGILIYQNQFTIAVLFTMTTSDFWWLLFLGLLCTSFAFLATIEVVKRLGAFTVSLSINLEPVYTILLAIFILKENELLSSKFYFGALIIIVVVIANGFIKHQLHKMAMNKPVKMN
ncbi:MAG: EamA family transporter [Flavobacteriia bacterium]|nr:EamA family transporter [Flavobacteriia bacterium]